MRYFKNILIALDLQSEEQAKIDRGIALAFEQRAKLTLMTVIPEMRGDAHLEISAMSPKERQALKRKKLLQQLDEIIHRIDKDDLETRTLIAEGKASVEIIKQVIRDQHDLLIISDQIKPKIRRALFGTTAIQLFRKCPCPILAIHPEHTGHYKKLMSTINVRDELHEVNKPLNLAIMEIADHLAKANHCPHIVLNIPPSDDSHPIHRERLNNVMQELDIHIDEDNIHLITGEAGASIPDETVRHDVDLLVMGMLTRTGILGFFIGRTAEKILNAIPCSILVLKPEGFSSPIVVNE